MTLPKYSSFIIYKITKPGNLDPGHRCHLIASWRGKTGRVALPAVIGIAFTPLVYVRLENSKIRETQRPQAM